jgi:phage baseplate assembly protein W
MSGLSPKLPVDTSNEGGYTLNKTYRQVVKQNFKHLLLTEPGEKIMDKNFGVGLKKFLFEPMVDVTLQNIQKRIKKQANIYLPYIEILSLSILTPDNTNKNPTSLMPLNEIKVLIKFEILPLSAVDEIKLYFNL